MRDPLTWSLPIGRAFGITVRVHLLFLFLMIGEIARGARYDYATQALIIQAFLFVSVLLHEFGHCFAARQVDGDASEILMWPLGGLAYCDAPHTPRAQFITVAGGPAVNLLLFLAAGGALVPFQMAPPLSPFWDPYFPSLQSWATGTLQPTGTLTGVPAFMARLFWINWVLFWFNTLLVAFPMDSGRILQCILWPRFGYHRATKTAVYCGYVVALLLSLYAFITIHGDIMSSTGQVIAYGNASGNFMLFFLALFIFVNCKQQDFLLETGGVGEDGVVGYDFSQGYTSLERDHPRPRRRPGFWQRWLHNRAARRRRREEEHRAAEERRLDELLAKVQRQGKEALTDEERRFLTRVSAKYRNRNRS